MRLIHALLPSILWAASCTQTSIQPETSSFGGNSAAGSPGSSIAGSENNAEGGAPTNGGQAGVGVAGSAGSSGAPIDAGGQAGIGGNAGQGGAGQAGVSSSSTDCPKAQGLPGPSMVRVQTPSGKSYCMDIHEVNQKQYSDFLEEIKGGPIAKNPETIHPQCKSNTFYPQVGDPEASCAIDPLFFLPEKYPNAPMGCVDWCDAKAYCSWAGKRLCGRTGGGTVSKDNLTNPEEDQWFNVCSMGGTSKYATGNSYQEGQCLDKTYLPIDPDGMSKEEIATRTEKKFSMNHEDVPKCHGTKSPFDKIHDINGSRFELTDACVGDGFNDPCFIRGGHLGSGEDEFDCTKSYLQSRLDATTTTGFRCCLDE
jgi:sulfatase modifying factor 1